MQIMMTAYDEVTKSGAIKIVKRKIAEPATLGKEIILCIGRSRTPIHGRICQFLNTISFW